MAKNKPTKAQKRKARMRKAKKWILTFEGANILLAYGKQFKVDPICAAKELELLEAITEEQRKEFRQREQLRLQVKREEQTTNMQMKHEERLNNPSLTDSKPSAKLKPKSTTNPKPQTQKKPKRRCASCGKAMKQQFIGLKHCKCGTSWSKADGYFERSPDMVFALQRKVTKRGKNSIRTKQVPVIRYNDND